MRTAPPLFWLALATVLLATGCAKNIPNTDVPDTAENREVIAFMERYRHALERRDASAILALASPMYLDDVGTPTGNDDLDYEALGQRLQSLFSAVTDIRYEIRYRRISYLDDKVQVEFTYTASFRLAPSAGEDARWSRRVSDHRAILSYDEETGEYAFLSGL